MWQRVNKVKNEKWKKLSISNPDGSKLVSLLISESEGSVKIIQIGRRLNHSSHSEECCQVSYKKTSRYRVFKKKNQKYLVNTQLKFLVAVEGFILTTSTLHLIKCISNQRTVILVFLSLYENLPYNNNNNNQGLTSGSNKWLWNSFWGDWIWIEIWQILDS